MKLQFILGGAAAICATSANAAKPLDLRSITASLEGEYLSYSGPNGSRITVDARTRIDAGDTKLDFALSQGVRKAGDEKFNATRAQATLVHNWSSRFSSRTSASIATSNPVFVNRELIQDISFKVTPTTVLTAGGRYARYDPGLDAWSWSLGAAQYFRGGFVSYRFSSFDIDQLGHAVGHLVSARLDDPYGGNQVWFGHGTALHDADWLGAPEKGNYTQIEYRRTQPIAGGVSVSLGVKRNWYDTPSTKFHGTGVRLGLIFNGRSAVQQEEVAKR